MKVRVEKVVRSEEDVIYFPQFLKWSGWSYFASNRKTCCWDAARFETEQEAWDFIKFAQEYPKTSYLYEEKSA